jgi:hypothetical protein
MSEFTYQTGGRPNGHTPAPPDKDKADRFRRVAPGRVQHALDAIGRVGYLADSRYAYSPAEAEQIVRALALAVEEVAHKLDREKPEKRRFAFG